MVQTRSISLPSLAITEGSCTHLLRQDDILYLSAEGSYTHIHLYGGSKVTVSRNLKSIASGLPESHFLRVHHSTVVNLVHVCSYNNSSYNALLLSDGSEIPVSRAKKNLLMERFLRL